MKKLLSIILAILMIVTTVPFAFAAEGDTEGTTIVITMEDVCYDGWNGNAIVIEQLIDGTYTEVATATFEDGESETFTVVLTEEGFYTFKWKAGDYPDECVFTLEVDDEVILKVTDCSTLSDGECLYEYVLCNHNYVDGKCDICGSDCPHRNITDSKCNACGAEGKFISIAMIDSYGDGWTGNAIQLDLVSKGEFTKIADVTIDSGSSATYRTVISSGEAFSLKWKVGDYPEECSFTVKVNGETIFEKSDCSDLADNEWICINCNHNFIDSICSICGLICGVDFSHKMNGGVECTACGFTCNHNYVNHYCMSCGYAEDGYYAGACGADDVNDVIWSLDSEGTLIISGEGEYDIPYVDVPWSVYGENIKNVVIEEGITNIVYASFYDLPNTVTLSIPSTVASIDAEGNNGFVEIKLADGNNYYSVIDGVLFNYDKTELIMYPAKKAGETYTVPDGVTTLGFASFRDVKNLKTVNISDDVTTIKYGCFAYSNSIENINFGKNVQHIEENAFLSTHVKTIVLPEKLTEISFSLFYDCDLLENLVIGSNVTKIGNYVLDYCDELETVHFLGTEEQWQAITKPDNSEDAINTVEVHCGAIEEKEAIDATCNEAGHAAGIYCDECNAYITGEEIPATGNHSVENGLCTECNLECGVDFAHSMKDGRCEDCGFICPHELYIDGKCTVCQKECSHIPGDQICTGYICKICGTVFGDEGDNTHHAWYYGECGYCGEPYPQDRPCTHIWNYNRSRCRLCGIYCSHETVADNICTECNFVVMPFSLTTGETVTYHGSFPDALDNAQDGSVIKLLKDYDDYENIEIRKAITLDLNGKEWYQPSSGYWNVYANATFTDSVGGGYLDYSLHFYSPVTISGGSYGYLSIDFETENTLGDYLADCCSYFDTDTDELIDADDEKIVSYVTVKAGHDLGSQTCKGYQCKECGGYFGEADPDAHDWSNLDGFCANGCGLECDHKYYNQERIRPVQNADGTWSKGTVKAICTTCGFVASEKEVERDHEGYAAFEESVAKFEALLNREDLIDGPKNDYASQLNNLKNAVYSLVYMEDEETVTRIKAIADSYVSEIEAGLADGTMKKADWTYMTALFEEINAIIDNDYHNIISSMNSYYLGPQGYYNGCSNSPTFTQASYNGNIHFEKQLETLLAGLKDGTALKADYTEIDEAIAEIEKKLADENVTDEAKAGLEEIKAQLEEMKADENTSAADLATLEKALEDYEAEIDAGIADGSAVKVDGQKIFNEKIQEINDELIEKYGEEIKEFSAALPDEVVAGIEKRTTAIYNEMTSLEGSVKDNEEKLAGFKAELDAIFAELENCFTGTHNGLKFEVTEEAKCGENAIESAICTLCGETVTREVENSALTHSFTKYEITEEAKCGVEGKKVAACDHGCGATDEKAIEALRHSFTKYEITKEAKCGVEGKKVAACDHGCGATDAKAITALRHSFTKYEITEEAKCGVEGKEVAACDHGCGATDEKAIAALTHKDADGDYKCDNGCGYEFEKPAPEEPADEDCDHLCHKGGFLGFIWKILHFFWKLFKMNPVCECGAAHY